MLVTNEPARVTIEAGDTIYAGDVLTLDINCLRDASNVTASVEFQLVNTTVKAKDESPWDKYKWNQWRDQVNNTLSMLEAKTLGQRIYVDYASETNPCKEINMATVSATHKRCDNGCNNLLPQFFYGSVQQLNDDGTISERVPMTLISARTSEGVITQLARLVPSDVPQTARLLYPVIQAPVMSST